ncbi:hypothetical protein MUK70_13495 [Dyadobacter chenwenxiniae]|uniref:Uncharacterized protein n=1 Tax=Dyadobacter chenwenxiniae TaxID=2906456 RepID=A0A9X1PGM2_9BACT|nr:hypothetical protein [Dyadobacter chenwenxiniae]MCF0053580.1 hypothetical protein [Dyadobacter chenwenxiniae]MCF0060256.1 hypothetical protein [Dyadobacter chenwenxiniae]UON85994.1 hypothetical protein MUK70_13495 [Dyadobacter chenwenxiniae]
MKIIRYIVQDETVLYNLNDYIHLLIDAKVLHPVMPQLRKSTKAGKTPMQIVLEKLEKFEPVYYLRYNQDLYVNWVLFEYFFRPLKPLLVNASDWRDEAGIFKQTQLFINESTLKSNKKSSTEAASYFQKITAKLAPSD